MQLAPLTIGYFGERMDLRIRQGGTFGPIYGKMRNPDQTPVNLTRCFIRGSIRKHALDAIKTAELECVITDSVAGLYEFGLSDEATATITAGEKITDPESRYVWDLELEDSLGRVIPLYYGVVIVLREATR